MDPEEHVDCCCEDESCGLHSGAPQEFPAGLSLAESVSWAIENDSAVPVDWCEKRWCGGQAECFYAGVVPHRWLPEEWAAYFIENVLFSKERYESSKPDATMLRTSDALIVTVIPSEKAAAVFQYDAVETLKNKRRKISLRRLSEDRVLKVRSKRDSLYGLNWTRVETQLSAISDLVKEMMDRNEQTVKDLIAPDDQSPSVIDVLKDQAMNILLDPTGQEVQIRDAEADAVES